MKTLQVTPQIVAVDCPSGVDCDSGQAAQETLEAELTVCMAAIKRGILTLPAFEYLGELRVVSIGLPEGLASYEEINRFVVEDKWVREVLPERLLSANKGTFGKALIIAGSRNYNGAALLAGRAAFRSGAGLDNAGCARTLTGRAGGPFPRSYLDAFSP